MAYRHGVYISEVPTSILPPVLAEAGMPVVFGTAPINMVENPSEAVNKPFLVFNYQEAVEAVGFAPANESGEFQFTLSEFMRSHFALFAAAPVVLVNVLDPEEHKTTVTDEPIQFVADKAVLSHSGALKESVVITGSDVQYVEGEDYELIFNQNAGVVVHRIESGSIPANSSAKASYDYLDSSLVDDADIIGGIDANTGSATGLELLNEVFPRTRLLPGQVLAPKFSTNPAVAAVMNAKASNINSHFRAISLTDIPTDEVTKYADAPAWKNNNNIVDPQQVVCWPMVKLGNEHFHLSTQLAGVICRTDAAYDGIPYKSPSNENLQTTATILEDGKEIWLGPDSAGYLNGEGIVTGLNFTGGWKLWGNRTAAYPGVSDVKDTFIPLRRMLNWIGNTLVLTFWQSVDNPLNRRQIDTVIDSANIWLNGLAGREAILGGRVEFLETENPITDLMDGIARFHVYVTPPSPNREIDFILEYDPSYLTRLFG